LKGITPLVAYAIIAVAVVGFSAFALTGGFSFRVLTLDDFGSCKLAQPERFTISCGAAGNPIALAPVVSSPDGTRFTVDTVESSIQSTSNQPLGNYELVDSATGQLICGRGQSSCVGKQLVTGRSYTWKTRCLLFCPANTELVYTGRQVFLKFSSTVGDDQVKVAGSANCVLQDFTTELRLFTGRRNESLRPSHFSLPARASPGAPLANVAERPQPARQLRIELLGVVLRVLGGRQHA